ncbi:unnamed protein product [Caenorhabditis auriculariae]|uniref:Saposin B-type domain-containing protein n=1 Tax=Caenorhabditis auriculariae TaxID=2777116 RepID=A0A8S1HNR2_9PELO|nr:unnamed protein product [Caenorhabditis auriculariae]
MKLIFSALLFLTLASACYSLTPGETCETCQVVLRTVYGHFSANVPSRKKLVNQLKHECKRHFTYRRRCLLAMKDQGEFIFREMTNPDFKPIKICFILKECKRLQSPIPEDFVLSNTTDSSVLSETTVYADDTETSVFPSEHGSPLWSVLNN